MSGSAFTRAWRGNRRFHQNSTVDHEHINLSVVSRPEVRSAAKRIFGASGCRRSPVESVGHRVNSFSLLAAAANAATASSISLQPGASDARKRSGRHATFLRKEVTQAKLQTCVRFEGRLVANSLALFDSYVGQKALTRDTHSSIYSEVAQSRAAFCARS